MGRHLERGSALNSQQFLLFPRHFDQSYWSLHCAVDLALREIDVTVIGRGRPHGDLILRKESSHVPVTEWSQAWYEGAALTWTELERQIEPGH